MESPAPQISVDTTDTEFFSPSPNLYLAKEGYCSECKKPALQNPAKQWWHIDPRAMYPTHSIKAEFVPNA